MSLFQFSRLWCEDGADLTSARQRQKLKETVSWCYLCLVAVVFAILVASRGCSPPYSYASHSLLSGMNSSTATPVYRVWPLSSLFPPPRVGDLNRSYVRSVGRHSSTQLQKYLSLSLTFQPYPIRQRLKYLFIYMHIYILFCIECECSSSFISHIFFRLYPKVPPPSQAAHFRRLSPCPLATPVRSCIMQFYSLASTSSRLSWRSPSTLHWVTLGHCSWRRRRLQRRLRYASNGRLKDADADVAAAVAAAVAELCVLMFMFLFLLFLLPL